MIAKLRFADLIAALAGILLFIASLLDQFGLPGSYDAWHTPVINDLIVTYLLGLAAATVSVLAALGVLPERLPWRNWAAGVSVAVLLNSIFSAVALSSLLHAVAGPRSPGIGAGLFLGIAGAVILFVGVALIDVVPGLASPAAGRKAPGEPVVGAGAHPGAWDAASTFTPGEPQPPAPTPEVAGQPAEGEAAPSAAGGAQAVPFASGGDASPYAPAATSPSVERSSFAAPGPPPFTPFWAAVPTPRPIYRAEDPSAVLATLHPGTWYAAVAPHAHGVIVQLPTGETGVLVEVADLFRG